MEIWKDVVGFEGIYQVSNLGNVKSLNYRKQGFEKLLTFKKHNKGYLQVQLRNNKINRTITVHRLVAEAFIPNPNNYTCINHKDENKQNNTVENLEWTTFSKNIIYSMRLHPERKRVVLNRPVAQCDKKGNVIKIWKDAHSIFIETKMSDWSISECCRGNRHTAYGYTWHYAD